METAVTKPGNKRLRRIILIAGFAVGAIGGWLYWKFVGCLSGTCPIWSNAWIATGYGGVLGWLLAGLLPFGLEKKRGKAKDDNSSTEPLSKEV